MKVLIISGVAAAGLLVAAIGIPRSHSISTTIGLAATRTPSTLQDMQGARAGKLPAEDFEDRSLVFPRETKR